MRGHLHSVGLRLCLIRICHSARFFSRPLSNESLRTCLLGAAVDLDSFLQSLMRWYLSRSWTPWLCSPFRYPCKRRCDLLFLRLVGPIVFQIADLAGQKVCYSIRVHTKPGIVPQIEIPRESASETCVDCFHSLLLVQKPISNCEPGESCTVRWSRDAIASLVDEGEGGERNGNLTSLTAATNRSGSLRRSSRQTHCSRWLPISARASTTHLDRMLESAAEALISLSCLKRAS